MAAGNITIGPDIATIECSATQFKATKSNANLAGWIVNGGTVNVFISFTLAVVPTADTQAQGVIKIPPGGSFGILHSSPSFSYITAVGAGLLYWVPQE